MSEDAGIEPRTVASLALTVYILANCCDFNRNVPADPLPPEPERFCGRREVLYLTPHPHPQHPAEGLPDLYQSRPDGLVPI